MDLQRVADAGRAFATEQPRTFAELGEELGKQWPDRDPQALTNTVRAWVALVQVPPRGLWGESGLAAHVPAETWLKRPLETNPSVDELLVRYLAAFGPATIKDMQIWCGLTRMREVAERLRPRLRTFRDEHGHELFDLPDAPRPDPETPAPPRFLGDFDNMLLSYADFTRIVATEHRKRIMRVNGILPGTVLVDGFVRGTWKITRERGAATLLVTPFERLSKKDIAALSAEGERLLSFAEADANTRDIRFSPPT